MIKINEQIIKKWIKIIKKYLETRQTNTNNTSNSTERNKKNYATQYFPNNNWNCVDLYFEELSSCD